MVSGYASPAAVLGACFTFTGLAFICVCLRLWARVKIIRQPGWDDACVTLAMAFVIVETVGQVYKLHYGFTKHTEDLTADDLVNFDKAHWVTAWNYFFGLGFAKLSIVLQCLRIFGQIPKFRTAAITLGVILFVFTLWTGFQSIFLCWPVARFWNTKLKGKCLPRLPIWFFSSAFNIVTDIAIVILPIPVVKDLQMSKREKVALIATLTLGGFVCIITIIRIYAIYALFGNEPGHKDPIHHLGAVAIFSNVEAALAIFASCLPTLKGLLTRHFPRVSKSRAASRTKGSDPSIELGGSTLGRSFAGKAFTTVTVQYAGGGRDGEGRKASWISKKLGISNLDSSGRRGSSSEEGMGEIEVVTTIEQFERRAERTRSSNSGRSEEFLVPAKAYSRP